MNEIQALVQQYEVMAHDIATLIPFVILVVITLILAYTFLGEKSKTQVHTKRHRHW